MIDWSRTIELRDEIGIEDFDEVVELFLEEVEGVIDRLRQQGKSDDLEQDLHFLKGSALNLGFRAFSDLCQDGERKAMNGEDHLVDMVRIVETFDASKAAFIRDMPERLAA